LDVGVSQSALSRWLKETGNVGAMKRPVVISRRECGKEEAINAKDSRHGEVEG
jgi:hypothetical protein